MISIITPTYNRAHLLPRMIQSVLNQTYKDWELIIVDDGSSDNTSEIISNYNDLRIKYYYTINSGAADSRNTGVELATNDYIVFLDSDDECTINWLALMINEIEKNNADVVSCGFEKYDFNGKCLETKLPQNLGKMFNNITTNFLSGSILMKKEYFQRSGGYDIELASGQHTELLIRLIPIFESDHAIICNIFKPLIKVHLHQGLRIRNNHEAIYQGSLRFLNKHSKLIKNNPDEYYDYLSVAAISAFRTNRIMEGKKLLFEALKLKPLKLKSVSRLIVSNISFVRNKIWGQAK